MPNVSNSHDAAAHQLEAETSIKQLRGIALSRARCSRGLEQHRFVTCIRLGANKHATANIVLADCSFHEKRSSFHERKSSLHTDAPSALLALMALPVSSVVARITRHEQMPDMMSALRYLESAVQYAVDQSGLRNSQRFTIKLNTSAWQVTVVVKSHTPWRRSQAILNREVNLDLRGLMTHHA